MTLLPHDNQDVRGLKGPQFPKYKVGPVCSVVGCSRYADHAHHIWRRSFLGGDFAWVELWDHTIVGNLMGLCWRHHEDVTKGQTWIRFEKGEFVYSDNSLTFATAIFPQPPRHIMKVEAPTSNLICPGCERPLPRAKEEGEPRDVSRRRKSWTVTVPDDGEDGAIVLDTLVSECARLFSMEDKPKLRYFVLVQALALVLQHSVTMSSETNVTDTGVTV